MIDRRTYQLLQDLIRREGRSLLQYAEESTPWNTASNGPILGQIREIAREEREGAAALSRHLAKNRLAPPYLGAYPSYFTSYNFLSLDRLLTLLLQHQKKGIEQLSADVRTLEEGETRSQAHKILEMKRRHLQKLEALAAEKAS